MPAATFGLYTTLGAIPWTAALAILGYALGANWEHVANDFHGPTYAIAGILVIGLVAVIVRRRRAQAAAPAPGGPVAAFRPDGPANPTGPAQGPLSGPYPAPGSWGAPPPAHQPSGYQPDPGYRPDPAGQYR
jgi:hypothetical protein